MKIIIFSLALICATSLISNPAETLRRAADAVETVKGGCPICTRCEFCGKEIHEDGDDVDGQEGAEAKCGCGRTQRDQIRSKANE